MLIDAVVEQLVHEYNNKPKEKNLVSFLTASQTNELRETGKISFGSIYNENKAYVEEAKLTAVQAFEDGIFAIFVNDKEIGNASQMINLRKKSIVTFIRLTFLAGSYYNSVTIDNQFISRSIKLRLTLGGLSPAMN